MKRRPKRARAGRRRAKATAAASPPMTIGEALLGPCWTLLVGRPPPMAEVLAVPWKQRAREWAWATGRYL